jgi:ketosteroid isomerase-like protein
MRTLLLSCLLLPGLASPLHAQTQFGLGPAAANAPSNSPTLLTDPTDTPGLRFLYDLERKFAQSTLEAGGAGFASWFAEDAVSLANGKPPVQGHDAIARQATWKPSDYQLTWTPDGGEMGAGGQMGYTWGHYSGHSRDAQGGPIVTSGRYMTIWKKEADGTWKVVLDSSNEGPALDCCKLP